MKSPIRVMPIVGGLAAIAGLMSTYSGFGDLNMIEKERYGSYSSTMRQMEYLQSKIQDKESKLDALYSALMLRQGDQNRNFSSAAVSLAESRYELHKFKTERADELRLAQSASNDYTAEMMLKLMCGIPVVIVGMFGLGTLAPKKKIDEEKLLKGELEI